ncbi:MAG: Sodium/hydrogen exchanger [Microgenomates group bacterium GW2011_GWA2_44_7]|nr:MAG: Sodium/hydrogen exchanger [Microgenomates group bacterium GW2011_GWA2_44_7]
MRNQERIIKITQGTNKSAYLIARAFRESDKRQLKELGANSVIQPEFEAALSIIHRILQEIGVDRSTVADTVKSIRAQADTISTDSKEQDRH